MSTGAVLVGSLLVWAILWALVEYRTLKDDIPHNHITAVVRKAIKAQPGPFLLFMFALGYLCGHLMWP